MKQRFLGALITVASIALAPAALAGHVTLSGLFGGSEDAIPPMSGSYHCDSPDALLGYQQIGPFQVSSTGLYDVADAGDQVAVDVVIRIYDGSFDPQNVQNNLVANAVDVQEQLPLEANNSYVMVIQHWCSNQVGAYGVALSGSGNITGTGVVASPAYWKGEFKLSDPQADFGFDSSIYNVNGPIRFDEAGTYYFSDLGWLFRTDLVLLVYQGSFNPAETGTNVVALLDDEGSVRLETGTDYYFVTYPWEENEIGEWHFAMFPPGAPAMNIFLEGAWNDPNMAGQGVLIDVMPTVLEVIGGDPFLFLAWFTFEEAAQNLQAAKGSSGLEAVGDSSQRWLTAFGTYTEGASEVELSFENTSGGAFNAETPKPSQDSNYGTGTLIVQDCNNLRLEYDLPTGPGSGSVQLNRSALDPLKFDLCKEFGQKPGVIK